MKTPVTSPNDAANESVAFAAFLHDHFEQSAIDLFKRLTRGDPHYIAKRLDKRAALVRAFGWEGAASVVDLFGGARVYVRGRNILPDELPAEIKRLRGLRMTWPEVGRELGYSTRHIMFIARRAGLIEARDEQ